MWYPPRLFILLACPLPSLCRGAMLAAVVPLLVPSGGSPLVPACLMFSAVLRRFAPSLAARAWLRAVSPCVPRLVPHPASSRHRCRCLCCYRPMASRYPPRLIDTTGGAIRWCRGGSLDFACLPLGQPSHPCGSSVLAAYRAAASRHLSRLGAIALGSVRLACPLSSWLSCLLSPCRHAVAVASSHHLIALRPVLSIRLAGRCLAVGRHRVGSSPVLFACRPCGVSSCPHGVVSFRPVLAVGAWCVGCVDGATACRSCGIFVLSIGCIYRLIEFLICPVCLLLLLSVSSYR